MDERSIDHISRPRIDDCRCAMISLSGTQFQAVRESPKRFGDVYVICTSQGSGKPLSGNFGIWK
jgi:hypothetical protein